MKMICVPDHIIDLIIALISRAQNEGAYDNICMPSAAGKTIRILESCRNAEDSTLKKTVADGRERPA